MRKYATNLLKIGVTILGLYLVLREVDLAAIVETLRRANLWWVLATFLLMNASLVLRAFRWLLLLRGVGASIRFGRLVELYFVGNFFNMFLLSGFGGDVVRVLEVARDVPGSVATGTVILDRFTGLLMLFVMSLFVLPFRPADFPDVVVGLTVGGALGGGLLLLLLMQGKLLRRLGSWLPGPLSPVGDGPIARLLQAVEGCGWQAVGKALGVSLVFNLMLALWWKTASLALGLEISFGYMLLVVPTLSVLMLVPSVSGLGPREVMAPMLFAAAGAAPETAVALSFLVFVVLRLSGILGAPVYVWSVVRDGRRAKAQSG